jgi:hypothetical protein
MESMGMDVRISGRQGAKYMFSVDGVDRDALTDAIMIGLRTNRPNRLGPTIGPDYSLEDRGEGWFLLTCRLAEGVDALEVIKELKFQLKNAPKKS